MPSECFHIRMTLSINVSFAFHFPATANADCRLAHCKICPQTMHILHITYLIKFNFIWNIEEHSFGYLHSLYVCMLRNCVACVHCPLQYHAMPCKTNICGFRLQCIHLSKAFPFDSIRSTALCLKTLSAIQVFDFKCFKVFD